MPATRSESASAADVVGTDLVGGHASVEVTAPGSRTLLAFLTTGCSVCQTFWTEFGDGPVEVPGRGRLVVVAKGPGEESASAPARLAGPRLEGVIQSAAAWSD